VYGLEVLQEAVQDFESNSRASRSSAGRPAADAQQDDLVCALNSTPGALYNALGVFAQRHINLSKLESRPLRGRPREYVFYIEIDAGRDEPACAAALAHLATLAQWTRVLGTYART
jgi:prephenate dehydratase